MRYLAIDWGAKRTGLAVGSDGLRLASPVEQIIASTPAAWLTALAKVIAEHEPDALVLGLPRNMDGTEGPAAVAARQRGAQLHAHFHLPVLLVDERLTSARADEQMARTGLTHGQKKSRRDALAAAVMLQDLLDGSTHAEPLEPGAEDGQ